MIFGNKRKKEEEAEAAKEQKILKARTVEIERRKKIDLHYGRTSYSSNTNYAEFSFWACFDELFNLKDSCWETDFNGTELLKITNSLNIAFDKQLILDTYADPKNHSAEVFHNAEDEQVFAYFDLQKIDDDQNGMFFFGLSCLKTDEPRVHKDLLEIYRKLKTKSTFDFYYGARELYSKVFKSYHYFYEDNYDEDRRQIHHHNLKFPLRERT